MVVARRSEKPEARGSSPGVSTKIYYIIFITRHYNGTLWLHMSKPCRNGWTWQSKKFIQLDEKLFPEIKWESNPVRVEFKKI